MWCMLFDVKSCQQKPRCAHLHGCCWTPLQPLHLSPRCCSQVIIERARLQLLPWGKGPYLEALVQRCTAGADIIFGADVLYEAGFVRPLMHTAAALLRPNPKVCCHLSLTPTAWEKHLAVAKASARCRDSATL